MIPVFGGGLGLIPPLAITCLFALVSILILPRLP